MASNKGRFNMLHSLSLRAKILLPFIILMLAGFAVVVGYNSWAMRQHDLEQGVENARLQAAVLSTSINKTLNDGLSTTQTLTSTFEILRRSHVVNRDMLNKILARQLENHAGLRAVWTGWEPDALDGRDSEYANKDQHAFSDADADSHRSRCGAARNKAKAIEHTLKHR